MSQLHISPWYRSLGAATTYSSLDGATYLALAEQFEVPLVTADNQLLKAVESQLKWVKALWAFEP